MQYSEIMPMLTVKDVARLLHIHVNTARRWSDKGILKSYRITRRGDRRFRQEDIARFLAEYNDFNMKKDNSREMVQSLTENS
jgi:excisionase family DNA binding protein